MTELSFDATCVDGSPVRIDLCRLARSLVGLFECPNDDCVPDSETLFRTTSGSPMPWTYTFQTACRGPAPSAVDEIRYPSFQPGNIDHATFEVAATFDPSFSDGKPALEKREIVAMNQLAVYSVPAGMMGRPLTEQRVKLVPSDDGSGGEKRWSLPPGLTWNFQFSTTLRFSKVQVFKGLADTTQAPFAVSPSNKLRRVSDATRAQSQVDWRRSSVLVAELVPRRRR